MFYFRDGSVFIIRDRFNNDRDAIGTEAFVENRFEVHRAALAAAARNRALNIIFRHRLDARLVDRHAQLKIHHWISALSRCNSDVFREFRKK